MKSLLIVAAVLLSSTASIAGACFNAAFVQGWTYDKTAEVLKLQSFSDVYDVKTSAFCNQLAWAQAIGFSSFGGGSMICVGDTVVVFDAFNRPVQQCRIEKIIKNAK